MSAGRTVFLSALTFILLSLSALHRTQAEFQAGAAIVDVTPPSDMLPVLVNGGMLSRSIEQIKNPVNARAIALADGETKLVIVVVDSCMMPRPLLDDAKAKASAATGIPTDHFLISATHTHTAPSCMGALGTDADPAYVPYLTEKLVEAIEKSLASLQPAQVGFGKADAGEYTALRRWIRRPDRLEIDPFGNPTLRANMHAAGDWDNVTGESGPEDPDLSLISFQTPDGKPIAVLCNFSMHYYGDRDISADYFGLFCNGFQEKLQTENADFVGIMSHGCSGDIWRRDYTKPVDERDPFESIDQFASGLLGIALQAYAAIEYQSDVDLAMAETRMTLAYRTPDVQRLEWAKRVVAEMGDRPPKDKTEVYAREQIILDERQETEIVMQGVRIGDIGIATTPNETYAITGLKIKAASPLPHNLVIELANGGDGYIPPPEQHLFGGYNTWAARSAGLEVMAEPKITEACIELLEQVAKKPRKSYGLSKGPASEQIADSKPYLWYRLNEFTGPIAADSSGNGRNGTYEPEATYFLQGPRSAYFCKNEEKNRAPMLAGGRIVSHLPEFPQQSTISLWVWNGMPNEGREVAGWFYSRGSAHGLSQYSQHLGVGGTSGATGKLIWQSGKDTDAIVSGKTVLPRWEWQHVAITQSEDKVRIYLNGELEMETKAHAAHSPVGELVFFGGRTDNSSNWEGRLDEIVVYERVLTENEIAGLFIPQ